MSMTKLASNANQKVKLILEKIVEEYDLGNGSGDITLGSHHFLKDTGIDTNQFLRILRNLEQNHILESFKVHANARTDDGDLVCFLKPLNHFKSRAEDYIERLEVPVESAPGFFLYLDKSNFWHTDKKKYSYPMNNAPGRLAILKYLAENKGVQPTKEIASFLGRTTKRIMNDVGKIRAEIKEHLKLPDVIENSKPDGYYINPKYTVIVTD